MSERGSSRGFWCNVRKTRKFAMLTIEDAWRTAFEMFAQDGRIVVPYRCTTKRTYSWNVRFIPHPNPWSFSPGYLRQTRMRRIDRPRFKPCGLWHLTRRTDHILPAPTKGGSAA